MLLFIGASNDFPFITYLPPGFLKMYQH